MDFDMFYNKYASDEKLKNVYDKIGDVRFV